VAAEAQQPRQPAQGVQRHLHGGNEDGMDATWIRFPVFAVLRRASNLLVLAAKFCSLNVKISDEPWPETVVLCPGGGVTWKGNIS
jgi:hypothetical protein